MRVYPKFRTPYDKDMPAIFGASIVVLSLLLQLGETGLDKILACPIVAKIRANYKRTAVMKVIWELKRKNMITARKNTKTFSLTASGTKKAIRATVQIHKLMGPDKTAWDGTWRMVIFDVPEKKRYARDYLRDLLKGMGFFRLQLSTWVTPHPIPEIIQDVLVEWDLTKYTRILHVDEIDDDGDLRTHYGI